MPGSRPLEAEPDPYQRRLAAPVWTRDPEECALLDGERDVLERGRTAAVREGHVVQLERRAGGLYVQASAFRSAARFFRITPK